MWQKINKFTFNVRDTFNNSTLRYYYFFKKLNLFQIKFNFIKYKLI